MAPDRLPRLFAVVVRLLERFPSQTSRGATDAGLGKSSPRVDPKTWFVHTVVLESEMALTACSRTFVQTCLQTLCWGRGLCAS
jgi:hypothetical protein